MIFSLVGCAPSDTNNPVTPDSDTVDPDSDASDTNDDTQNNIPDIVYEATWDSVNQHNTGGTAPEWFMDAKFGIYMHWGPYCVPAFGSEWYAKYMYETDTGNYRYHTANYGDPFTDWGYEKFMTGAYDKNGNWVQFAPKLKSEGGSFDPDEWAQLFKDAGAKFAGMTAEHADGWSNWDSEVNEWNAVDMGPKLDLVGLVLDAIEEQGLKTVLTMHHQYSVNGGYFTDVPQHEDESLKKLFYQNSYGDKMNLFLDKLIEIIDGYQPDIIWQDSGLWNIEEDKRLEFLAYYYNKEKEWGKEVVATAKGGLTTDCSVQDYERGGPMDILPNYYLTDDSISPYTWSYTNGITIYSSTEIIHSLMDRVSKNGNLLLNVCPTAEGVITDNQKKVLLEIGDWLERNGEAVYSTRAWTVYGEGPTQMGSEHFSNMVKGTADDIRFTRSKDNKTLYVTVLGWPEDGNIAIESLGSSKASLRKLESVELFGATAGEYIPLSYSQTADSLMIVLPDEKPIDQQAYCLKLSFNGEIPDPTTK